MSQITQININGDDYDIGGGGGITDVKVDGASVVTGGVAEINGKASASDLTAHTSDTASHVTSAEKTAWSNKQNALTPGQLNAANSGITATKVADFDDHLSDSIVHVTAAEKGTWNLKQDQLLSSQMDTVNSSVTLANVLDYDSHIYDSLIHTTSFQKADWNAKYDKPATGIPKTDLASDVQTSLGKADTISGSETWTFTLDDSTTVTKKVLIAV